MPFKLYSQFKPTGDQPQAIQKLVKGIQDKHKHQTLLGVTGSGKTFTMANIVEQVQKPTLVISHNKTLAAQLYQEFKQFFPENAVHYFVSYYDYYQPEAYIPQSDTYIEKEATINEEIDRLRHAATQSLLNRDDCLIVSSVSCIYGLGERKDYEEMSLKLKKSQTIKRNALLKALVAIQYERNDTTLYRGQFRVRGNIIDIHLTTGEALVRINMLGDKIDNIKIFNINADAKKPILALDLRSSNAFEADKINIIPAKHFMTPHERMQKAISQIKKELKTRLNYLRKNEKEIEAYRLERKTNYDLEMIREVGYCNGIENYSRYLSGRGAGEPPSTLIDFFPKDFLTIIDESHVTIPQIRGMHAGDKSRKTTLIDFGFRLPSARDNRPLNFQEFNKKIKQALYVSATPSEYEIRKSKQVVEQIIRPTGLLDPQIEVHKNENQIEDLIAEAKKRIAKKQRVLITTLTKRMSEELDEYLRDQGLKTKYLHSEIKTLERTDILADLQSGKIDIIVGINLLREGLDLPEVSLVIILDADMSGFLRNETSLVQTIGRAARNKDGHVIMYADKMSPAMHYAISETQRRRKIQENYNKRHNITPRSIGE